MTLAINLLAVQLVGLNRANLYSRPFDKDMLDEIRNQVGPNTSVTRFGDEILGYALPTGIIERYEFKADDGKEMDFNPRYVNSLLRFALKRRMEKLGFRKAGYDKFQSPVQMVFGLGDQKELVAQKRWLIRPFSLPSGGTSIFALLVNPSLSYRFKLDLETLAQLGFHFARAGQRIRTVRKDLEIGAEDAWETAHTAVVLENRENNVIVCRWKDGTEQEAALSQCWPLATSDSRYDYLRRHYSGAKGESLVSQMETKQKEFFDLKNVCNFVKEMGKQIGEIEIDQTAEAIVGDLLELGAVSEEAIDRLQPPALNLPEEKEAAVDDEGVTEEDDPEEYTQLGLF